MHGVRKRQKILPLGVAESSQRLPLGSAEFEHRQQRSDMVWNARLFWPSSSNRDGPNQGFRVTCSPLQVAVAFRCEEVRVTPFHFSYHSARRLGNKEPNEQQ
jgi:hypothetical protein